jgi:tetratricopeptide (TPR) repeat protein
MRPDRIPVDPPGDKRFPDDRPDRGRVESAPLMGAAKGASVGNIDFEAWRRRIRQDTFGNYHLQMGIAIEKEGDDTAAFAAYRRAIEIDPDGPGAYCRAVPLLNRHGRTDEALALERSIRDRKPDYRIEYLNGLIDNLAALSEFDEAARVIDTVLAGEAPSVAATVHARLDATRGEYLIRIQRPDEAIACLERGLARDPEQPMARYWMGWILFERGDHQGAAPHFEKALVGLPDRGWGACMLGYCRLLAGRFDEADLLIREGARTAEPDKDTWVRQQLGMVAFMRGDIAGVLTHERCLAAMEPDGPKAPFLRFLADAGAGRHADAERMLRRFLTLIPGALSQQALLGLIMAECGGVEEGLRVALDTQAILDRTRDDATRFAQNDVLVPMVVGLLLTRAGRRDEASALFRQSAERRPQMLSYVANMVSRVAPWAGPVLAGAYRELGLDPADILH